VRENNAKKKEEKIYAMSCHAMPCHAKFYSVSPPKQRSVSA